jgi:hypothetical protein
MTPGAHHQHSDWEQQIEQLSAYLDNEVDETDRAALEQHLPTCEACRRTLEELGQSRTLLRTLPAPPLSRSFLLPEAGAIPEPISRGRTGTALASSSNERARARRARTLQWIGGLVAVLGLFILISTTAPGRSPSLTAASSAPGNGQVSSNHEPSNITQNGVPTGAASGSYTPDQADQPGRGATPGQVDRPTAAATPIVTAPYGGIETPSLPLGPLAGAALLMAGSGLLVGGTILVRRRSRHLR